eukprot:756071-Hanusia_phi.AAC.2
MPFYHPQRTSSSSSPPCAPRLLPAPDRVRKFHHQLHRPTLPLLELRAGPGGIRHAMEVEGDALEPSTGGKVGDDRAQVLSSLARCPHRHEEVALVGVHPHALQEHGEPVLYPQPCSDAADEDVHLRQVCEALVLDDVVVCPVKVRPTHMEHVALLLPR